MFSACYQCWLSVILSVLVISDGHQCWLSVLVISVGYQCWLSALVISAGYQCCYQCWLSVLVTTQSCLQLLLAAASGELQLPAVNGSCQRLYGQLPAVVWADASGCMGSFL